MLTWFHLHQAALVRFKVAAWRLKRAVIVIATNTRGSSSAPFLARGVLSYSGDGEHLRSELQAPNLDL